MRADDPEVRSFPRESGNPDVRPYPNKWSKLLKLIVFDVDGTLVDSQHMICAAMHEAYTAHGLAVPARERLLSIVGLSLSEAFTSLGDNVEGYPVATLADRYRTAHFALREAGLHEATLFPGASDAVHALARQDDVVLGIATGKSRRGAVAFVERYGFTGCFATIQTADDAPSKPHPGMVLQAMVEVGAGPADTVMVGDSIYDMAMARAAGATPLGVGWGYCSSPALRDAGADIVMADFTELLPQLRQLWRSPAVAARVEHRSHA